MKILISIPLYLTHDLHWEFTQQTIDSIKTADNEHQIFLINNHSTHELLAKAKETGCTLVDNPKGNVLSAAWNMGIKYGQENGFDYILTMNNDLILHPDAIDNLVKFAQEHPDFLIWTMAEYIDMRSLKSHQYDYNYDEHPHFSCFMVGKDFQARLGEKENGTKEPYPGLFDENLAPAYFEDSDMAHRTYRAGMKAAKTGSALFYHFGSRTIKVDEELNIENGKTYEKNRAYFITKWGYDPHGFVPNKEEDRVSKGYPSAFTKST